MTVRRYAAHIATVIVALCVALAMPASQLRTRLVTETCCCPDPSHCHCPPEKPDPKGCPAMKPCHKVQHETVAPEAPSVVEPAVVATAAQPRVTVVAFVQPIVPEPAPSPDEPYGPS